MLAQAVAFLEAAYFALYLALFRLVQRVMQRPLKRRRGELDRTVLLVGDGLAEGVGDALAKGGLSTRLAAILAKEGAEMGLRLNWTVANCGCYRSSSEDWLPGSDRPPPTNVYGVHKSLFVDTFVEGDFRDAQVVVIFLGGEDERVGLSAEQTIANIRALAQELMRRGKLVVIATVPSLSRDKAAQDRVRQKNRMLENVIATKFDAEATDHGDKDGGPPSGAFPCLLGPDTNIITSQGGYYLDPVKDGYNLSPHGFRLLSGLTRDAIHNPCRRIEWAHWKPLLDRLS